MSFKSFICVFLWIAAYCAAVAYFIPATKASASLSHGNAGMEIFEWDRIVKDPYGSYIITDTETGCEYIVVVGSGVSARFSKSGYHKGCGHVKK